jgi:hypothetical protein
MKAGRRFQIRFTRIAKSIYLYYFIILFVTHSPSFYLNSYRIKVMMVNYSRTNVLHLYKKMLREAQQLTDYNFREHALRRIKAGFRKDSTLTDLAAMAKYAWGLGQLGVIRRSVAIGKLYPSRKKVVEKVQEVKAVEAGPQ